LDAAVPAVAVEIGGEGRRLREERQAKGQPARQDEPEHGPPVARVLQGVQGDAVLHAAAERQGHKFGDVHGEIPEARHGGKHRFERHHGDDGDQDLGIFAGRVGGHLLLTQRRPARD